MKTKIGGRLLKGIIAATLVGVVTFTCMPAKAAHELIYIIDQYDNLSSFYSDAPGTLLTTYPISGLKNNETITGIDSYAGTIYGLGSFGELYTISTTGVATMVGTGLGIAPNGATFGVDNGPAGLQVVSALGQSLLVNRTTGLATLEPALHYATGDPFFGVTPRVDALAYNYVTGQWYADDTLQNSLAKFDPITGALSTIGANGIDAARFNGLDVSPNTVITYMGTPAASSDPQANLYTVNLTTGLATLVGQIDYPGANTLVRGLTVIPEPSSVALLALGAFGLWFARRRQ